MPYYHSNVDSDEVMFYVGGDYEARKGSGIGIGSISLHPGGFAHGPQPSAIEASLGVEYFEESAVMVDTFAPLDLGEGGLATDDPAYAWTWAGRPARPTGARRCSPTPVTSRVVLTAEIGWLACLVEHHARTSTSRTWRWAGPPTPPPA